jgi:hypothetical protein
MKKDLMKDVRTRHNFIKTSLNGGGIDKVDRYFDLLEGISYVDKYNKIYNKDLKYYNDQMKKMSGGKGFFKTAGKYISTFSKKKKIDPYNLDDVDKTIKTQEKNIQTIREEKGDPTFPLKELEMWKEWREQLRAMSNPKNTRSNMYQMGVHQPTMGHNRVGHRNPDTYRDNFPRYDDTRGSMFRMTNPHGMGVPRGTSGFYQ